MSNPDSTAPPKLDYFTPATNPIYAGFWMRVSAFVLDLVLLTLTFSGIGLFYEGILRHSHAGQNGNAFFSTMGFQKLAIMGQWVTIWLYFSLLESSGWQATAGKRLVGIQVTDLQGNRISFGRATGRFWAKLVSAVPFYIGFLFAGMTSHKQAVHDMLANTLVIQRRSGSVL